MMKAAPTATCIVIEPNLLLQFEIAVLDSPADLGEIDQALEGDVGRQCRAPVVIRLGRAVGPLGGGASPGRQTVVAGPMPTA